MAPDVGEVFTWPSSNFGDARFRVESWMQNNPDGRKSMRWCYREEATHVSGRGVCGCVAPINEIKIVGKVSWTEKQIDEDLRQPALRLAKKHTVAI